MDKFQLHVIRQTGRNSVHIIFFSVSAFRLEKQLVCIARGELDDLVLDRWTIARTGAFNPAGEQRRAIEIGSDNFVRPTGGVSDPAGQLFHVELTLRVEVKSEDIVSLGCRLRTKGKSRRRLVAQLNITPRKINRPRAKSARRARLEPADLKSELAQIFA